MFNMDVRYVAISSIRQKAGNKGAKRL